MSTESKVPESGSALVPVTAKSIVPVSTVTVEPPDEHPELSAQTPVEMLSCQNALIQWCKNKVVAMQAEHAELDGAYRHALKQKWKVSTLKRHAELAAKRVVFYQKMQGALEAGYYIVPNFPVTLFAIRTDRKKPATMFSPKMTYVPNLNQEGKLLPQGEGTYQNPVPLVKKNWAGKSEQGHQLHDYWAYKWDDLEFPANMAKLHIMDATTRAMQMKIFDELGMMPADRQRHPDPILVGRINDPRPVGYGTKKFVTFMIAWHLDTRTL